MILILDEPLFDIVMMDDLNHIISELKKEGMIIGLHCCSRQNINDFDIASLDYLSLDCSLFKKNEILELKTKPYLFIAGVIDTSTAKACGSAQEITDVSEYISPACGLAFSEIKVCSKVLSSLSLL